MKIGQIVKNTLEQLSTSSWKSKEIIGEARSTLEITVDPKYSRAVAILIKAGLKILRANNSQYKYIGFFLTNDIFIQLVSYDENAHLPKDFFNKIETAINHYVTNLSSNWIKSNKSINEIIIPESYVENYGDEMVIFEHPSLSESDVLLGILACEYNYLPNVLSVTDSTRKENNPPKDFIIGKEEFVSKFINIISEDLSPSHYDPIISESKQTEGKLKDLCVKAISRYSLFYPEVFSLDILPNYNLPEDLLNEIEETSMEHVQEGEGMNKYKGKIIVFKTTFSFWGDKGYLIYPERKDLKIGIVSEKLSNGQWGETGYVLTMLLIPESHNGTFCLFTSNLKYSNFKCRVPSPSELEKINEAFQSKKAKFNFRIPDDQVIKAIDKQQSKNEQTLAQERSAGSCKII